ncbi:vWA domain-containing protein [Tichowtungia aerotolerans]|uniref:VWFA domain-containing protein n=1 Tax=Tichowtungia aerotolerans TaxID=2697043 RepID=A0A6P1MCC5_9BACT|nr:hypothetical protein [Tichowtungia aerotolerans]QHI70763.1 hypothetical protein GT409_15385 [Tichowtungia aerotolerans]
MKETLKKLVHRKHVCSAEAAAVSIVVHILLILLAGSVVAVRYVQKRDAEMDVVITEPKLERRQLQLPQKLDRVRRTTRRPKILSTKASASATEFSVPEMGNVGEVSSQKFDSPFARGVRDFRVLTAGIGIGAPKFKFLGIRGEGEKVVFILDGSEKMLSEESGGADACEYIRTQLNQVVSELPSSVLFNVLLYDGETVDEFRPHMVPVTATNRSALAEWLAPFWKAGPEAGLSEDQNTYVPETVYETAIGDETREWVRSLQAALEQRPDTVFVVSRDWGRHSLSREKGMRLVDFTLWQLLSGNGGSSVGGSSALAADRELRDSLIQQAVEAVQEEDDVRSLTNDPEQFLRDLISYIQYSEDQIYDHIDAVVQSMYTQVNMAPPWIHFVRLVPDEDDGVIDDAVSKMSELTRIYGGEFAFLNGKDAVRRVAGGGDEPSDDEAAILADVDEEKSEAPESGIEFYNIRDRGSRIAFVLDASEDVVEEAVGGTNAFEFLKQQLVGMSATMTTGTLFNVIISDEDNVFAFKPEMAAFGGVAELGEWLTDILPGQLPETNRYEASSVYDSPLGADVQGFPLALQVAMEQKADLIFTVGTGMGRLKVGKEKARRLLNFSILDALGGDTDEELQGETEEGELVTVTSSTSPESNVKDLLLPLENDKEQRDELIRQALMRIQSEMDKRKKAGLPPGFVHSILDYIEYTPQQIVDHLMEVGKVQYPADDDGAVLPRVHFAVLLEPGGRMQRDEFRVLRRLAQSCSGEIKMVYGADTEKEMRKLNRMLDLYP